MINTSTSVYLGLDACIQIMEFKGEFSNLLRQEGTILSTSRKATPTDNGKIDVETFVAYIPTIDFYC
jgi:hypothetical protein